MNKNEISELKKRFTKNHCSFTRLCGCYVDAEKNRIVDLNETFLNLDEEEMHKYLDLAKKCLSGTLGNNLLNLNYPLEEEGEGGMQRYLMALKESALKNPELLERFYEQVIEKYDQAGNYLILLFHDAYDVIKKSSDGMDLDESEEVYEYLLCAICPVILSKPGLGYREDEGRIGSRIRDWIVGVPETGFLFPAFNDRSSDIHSLLFYTKNAKEPHWEMMDEILRCSPKTTAAIQRKNFENILQEGLGAQTTENEILYMDLQIGLHDMVTEQVEVFEREEEDYLLDEEQLQVLLQDNEVPQESADRITEAYRKTFADDVPAASGLIDKRALKSAVDKKEKMELVKEVASLSRQLNESLREEAEMIPALRNPDVVLKVTPQKAAEITIEEINGQRCAVIPLEEDEQLILDEQP